MKVVVVESPAKARSLSKYLGNEYKVLASYGHVRDLPSKKGSVKPEDGFAFTWQVQEGSEKHLRSIAASLKNAHELILATDPDREGEAISWHLVEFLKSENLIHKCQVKRVAFNAVTKAAVIEAMAHPRVIDQELVDAYMARLGLDYLVGFTLSPVLWRKLPGSRSAGRVQSVTLRLVVDREKEIETFQTQEYWSIEGDFGRASKPVKARLTHFNGEKLGKFSLPTATAAQEAVRAASLPSAIYQVQTVERRRVKKNPQPPFITSTLQQEAMRKLGMSASKTMSLAQKLYEGVDLGNKTTGLITYMRTDSVQVTPDAITQCRKEIQKEFGPTYVPQASRAYKTKAKNAQEAHEAIRPTDLSIHPKNVAHVLDPLALKLYELIWKRMMASQMASAEMDQAGVDIATKTGDIIFRATGSVLVFAGFLKLYQENKDEGEENDTSPDQEHELPDLKQGQVLDCEKVTPYQHFTQPPPRYSEASLVKKMEELGIGRPSTYARTLHVLQERDYVRQEKRQLIPQERGRIVTSFLSHFFKKYVEYDFTANLEEQLDDISSGELPWKEVLGQFWEKFSQTAQDSESLTIKQVLEVVEADLHHHLFPGSDVGQTVPCPRCNSGTLGLRLGRFGSFVGCSSYPECAFTRPLREEQTESDNKAQAENGTAAQATQDFSKMLGEDPTTQETISLRLGPYGPYLQWGEGTKPKRVSLPKGLSVADITLERALDLGQLPREVGLHPETGKSIAAGIGRFGPYVKYESRFISLKKEDNVLTITLERALELIRNAPPPKTRAAKAKAPKKTPPKGKSQKKSQPKSVQIDA